MGHTVAYPPFIMNDIHCNIDFIPVSYWSSFKWFLIFDGMGNTNRGTLVYLGIKLGVEFLSRNAVDLKCQIVYTCRTITLSS
jgi:hypothetical protein